MLHTKLRGNRPAGSREYDFKRFLLYEYVTCIVLPSKISIAIETNFFKLSIFDIFKQIHFLTARDCI